MKVLVVTGSRADEGMLAWPLKVLREDSFFDVRLANIHGCSVTAAFAHMEGILQKGQADLMLVLGDRYEIMAACMTAHLQRIPIAHIGGGDVTEGSYDDAMRDAISRMASIHFVTSTSAMARLTHMGYKNVHLVGSPGIDYIKQGFWKKERPYSMPYVVVSYQAETQDKVNDIVKVLLSLDPDKRTVFILPNPDLLSADISNAICQYAISHKDVVIHDVLPHDKFLNLIYHCDEFIGNSSSMLYEAPEMGVKVRMIGKRQRGRVVPWGDGHASERIAKFLKYAAV